MMVADQPVGHYSGGQYKAQLVVPLPAPTCHSRYPTPLMKFVRTDDARFERLSDYDYAPNYLDVDDTEGGRLRLHYVDAGSPSGETIVCLHGEPTWGYLYRRMTRVFVEGSCRVVLPDLIGFGRSDKPLSGDDYTYARHVRWVRSALDALNLDGFTLVCHDWGGLIGLRLVGEEPDRFRRVVVMNTGLPTGKERVSDAFLQWREQSQAMPVFPVGALIDGACCNRLDAATIAAYNAPFPDESYKAGVRRFPLLVPISPEDPASEANSRAWEVLRTFDRPFLTIFSDHDPLSKGGEKVFQRRVPGAHDRPHVLVKDGGHFLQEDKSDEVASTIVAFMRTS
jgi:haloalkane dehalogenase